MTNVKDAFIILIFYFYMVILMTERNKDDMVIPDILF